MLKAAFDTALPLIGAKVRLDDIVGYQTLQTDPVATPWSTETNISICVRSLARVRLNDKATPLSISPLNAIRDEEIISTVADRRNIKDQLRYFPLLGTVIFNMLSDSAVIVLFQISTSERLSNRLDPHLRSFHPPPPYHTQSSLGLA